MTISPAELTDPSLPLDELLWRLFNEEEVRALPLGRLVGRADSAAISPGSPVTLSVRPEALGFGNIQRHSTASEEIYLSASPAQSSSTCPTKAVTRH